MSDSLQPHGRQHARLYCSSQSPQAYSNSCPLSWWCHPTISSSVILFSSCLLFYPASGSFPMSQLFAAWSQSIGASASASVLPINIQGWFPLELTGWISLLSKGLPRVFSNAVFQKHQSFGTHTRKIRCATVHGVAKSQTAKGPALWSTLTSIHDYWKNLSFDYVDFVGKLMSLLFNMPSRLVIAFLPRNKWLLISWLQSPSAVILEPKKIKSVTVSVVSPSTCHDMMGLDAMILVFWMLSFKPDFSLSSFTIIQAL